MQRYAKLDLRVKLKQTVYSTLKYMPKAPDAKLAT